MFSSSSLTRRQDVETEEEKKRQQASIRQARLEAARKDLERRETTKIQAAVRGMLLRKVHDYRKEEYHKMGAAAKEVTSTAPEHDDTTSQASLSPTKFGNNSGSKFQMLSPATKFRNTASQSMPIFVQSSAPSPSTTMDFRSILKPRKSTLPKPPLGKSTIEGKPTEESSPVPFNDFKSRLKSHGVTLDGDGNTDNHSDKDGNVVVSTGHHSFNHAGEFLVTVGKNNFETEEEKRKRVKSLRNNRLEAARKDLERREATIIQALVRGVLSRKRHDHRTGEYRKKAAFKENDQSSDVSLGAQSILSSGNNITNLHASDRSLDPLALLKSPLKSQKGGSRFAASGGRSASSFLPHRSTTPNATDFRSHLKSRETGGIPKATIDGVPVIEKKSSHETLACTGHHSFNHAGEFLVTVGKNNFETEEEKRKRVKSLRNNRLEAARKDLERREATIIQALVRGVLSRKRHDHRTGEYRKRSKKMQESEESDNGSKASLELSALARPQSVSSKYGAKSGSPPYSRGIPKFGNHSMPCMSGRPPLLPKSTEKVADFRSILRHKKHDGEQNSTKTSKDGDDDKECCNSDDASQTSSYTHGAEFLVTEKGEYETEVQKKQRFESLRHSRLEAARKDFERREATIIQANVRGFLLRLKHDCRTGLRAKFDVKHVDLRDVNRERATNQKMPLGSIENLNDSVSSIGTGSLLSDGDHFLSPLPSKTSSRFEKINAHFKASGRRDVACSGISTGHPQSDASSGVINPRGRFQSIGVQDYSKFLVTARDSYATVEEKKKKQAEIRSARLAVARQDLRRREATSIQAAVRGMLLRKRYDCRTGEYRRHLVTKSMPKATIVVTEHLDHSEGSFDGDEIFKVPASSSSVRGGTNESIARSSDRHTDQRKKAMSSFVPRNDTFLAVREQLRSSTEGKQSNNNSLDDSGGPSSNKFNSSCTSMESGGSEELAAVRENLVSTQSKAHKEEVLKKSPGQMSPVKLYIGMKSKLRSTKKGSHGSSPMSEGTPLISPIASLRGRLRSVDRKGKYLPKVPTMDQEHPA